MSEMRIRPKSDYMQTADWQQLFILTEHWQRDMDFYKDELKFLHKLVDKYFIWLLKDEHIQKVRILVQGIEKAHKESQRLGENIAMHLGHLEALMENAFSQDEEQFRYEHAQLENELVEYTKTFRQIKKEVFAITERVMESEKLKHLLKA